jgi:hypothetical protein
MAMREFKGSGCAASSEPGALPKAGAWRVLHVDLALTVLGKKLPDFTH